MTTEATTKPEQCWWTQFNESRVERCKEPSDGESPYCTEHRPWGWKAAAKSEDVQT